MIKEIWLMYVYHSNLFLFQVILMGKLVFFLLFVWLWRFLFHSEPANIPIAEIIAPATIIPKSGEFSLLKVMLFAILNVPYSASIYIMPKKRVNAHFPFPNLRWSDDLHPTIEQPVLALAFFQFVLPWFCFQYHTPCHYTALRFYCRNNTQYCLSNSFDITYNACQNPFTSVK